MSTKFQNAGHGDYLIFATKFTVELNLLIIAFHWNA